MLLSLCNISLHVISTFCRMCVVGTRFSLQVTFTDTAAERLDSSLRALESFSPHFQCWIIGFTGGWQCKIRMALCTDGSQHLHRCGGDVCNARVSWRGRQWPQVSKGAQGRGTPGVSHVGCPGTKWVLDAFLADPALLFQSTSLSPPKCAHPNFVLFSLHSWFQATKCHSSES